MSDELKPAPERTRKRYKAVIAIGGALMLLSPVACAAGNFGHEGMRNGLALFLIGFFVYLGARAFAWWKQG